MHPDAEVGLAVVNELLLAGLGALDGIEEVGREGGSRVLEVERDVGAREHAEAARLDVKGEERVGDDLGVEVAVGQEGLVERVLDREGVVEGGGSGG
mgnify:CR=1 FL=1